MKYDLSTLRQMKLPSLKYLASNASSAAQRFPLPLISAIVGAALGIYMIEEDEKIQNIFPYLNTLLCAALGIVLFFCVGIYTERKGFEPMKRRGYNLMAFSALALIWLSLPDWESVFNPAAAYIRYGVYLVIIHLMVSFTPFLAKGKINGFWNYNKSLFLRFLTSVLFSGVLYAGLALALGSLDFLFDVDLHDKLFAELWVSIAGIFNTWFFLSGVPKNLEELEDIRSYPKGLKIFTQYVLLSLLGLYLIILYAYSAKIILTWSWPKGLVPYLVSSVSVLGILTLMLLYPYGESEESSWIKKVSRWYYLVLLPLVVLMFIALCFRLSDYGVTINRYALFVLGIWLAVVCFYFISGRKSIKFVPISLSLTLLLVCFGPWGMFSVSERSQVARLEKILTDAQILVNGKIVNEIQLPDSCVHFDTLKTSINDRLLNDSLIVEVTSIMSYLDDFHGYESIRGWFKQDLSGVIETYDKQQAGIDSNARYRRRWNRMQDDVWQAAMGVRKRSSRIYIDEAVQIWSFSSTRNSSGIVDIKGFDYIVNINDDSVIKYVDSDSSRFFHFKSVNSKSSEFIFGFTDDTVSLPIANFIKGLYGKGDHEVVDDGMRPVPQDSMVLRASSARYDYQIDINYIHLNRPEDDTVPISYFNLDVKIRKK